jgi:dTDP-4-amino-4,6-dideoxygalactose transaminase
MSATSSSPSSGVPLLDLQAQYRPLRAEILAAIERVCDSQRFIMGPEITGLEHEMASMLGVRHAVAVSSGTDALLLALMALDIKAGDEVVTPTYSFFATAGAVARLGATPVLVDIDESTFNMDPAKLAAAITPKTRAIIPVHLFGQSAEMKPSSTSRKDSRGRRRCAAIGHVAAAGGLGVRLLFAFKNLGFGDAGLVTTNNEALAKSTLL